MIIWRNSGSSRLVDICTLNVDICRSCCASTYYYYYYYSFIIILTLTVLNLMLQKMSNILFVLSVYFINFYTSINIAVCCTGNSSENSDDWQKVFGSVFVAQGLSRGSVTLCVVCMFSYVMYFLTALTTIIILLILVIIIKSWFWMIYCSFNLQKWNCFVDCWHSYTHGSSVIRFFSFLY